MRSVARRAEDSAPPSVTRSLPWKRSGSPTPPIVAQASGSTPMWQAVLDEARGRSSGSSRWSAVSLRARNHANPPVVVLMRLVAVVCASLIAVPPVTIAQAEKGLVNLGVLTCTLVKRAQDTGQKMLCGFKPARSGAEEKYSGTIRESGEELPTGRAVLIWTVLGPADVNVRVGILAQCYVKGTIAPGQPPTLIGETNSAIVLQFETNDSSASYDSISLMELELTGTPA